MVEGAANRFLWVISLWVRDPIQSAPFAQSVFQKQSNWHACKHLKQVWSLEWDYTTILTRTHRRGLSVRDLTHIDNKLAPSDIYSLCIYSQLLNLCHTAGFSTSSCIWIGSYKDYVSEGTYVKHKTRIQFNSAGLASGTDDQARGEGKRETAREG